MRVRCLANRGSDLPKDCLDPSAGYRRDTIFDVEVGKEYVVYALILRGRYIWYCLSDDPSLWNPSPLFEVTDGRLSRYWRFAYERAGLFHPDMMVVSFPEWAGDSGYCGRLMDGEKADVAVFDRYKDLMDLEFPDPSVRAMADDLGDAWLMCSECQESWEEPSRAGMVRCPGCRAVIRSPLYREESG